jgi:hypothetical protein
MFYLNAHSLHQGKVLLYFVAAGNMWDGVGQEGLHFSDVVAHAAGDAGQVGQQSSPPVVEAQDDCQVEIFLPQQPGIAPQDDIRLDDGLLCLAGEAGERAQHDLVNVGIAGDDGLRPRSDQAGDAGLRESFPQSAQSRGGEQQIAQMVGADEEDGGWRLEAGGWRLESGQAGKKAQECQTHLLASGSLRVVHFSSRPNSDPTRFHYGQFARHLGYEVLLLEKAFQ